MTPSSISFQVQKVVETDGKWSAALGASGFLFLESACPRWDSSSGPQADEGDGDNDGREEGEEGDGGHLGQDEYEREKKGGSQEDLVSFAGRPLSCSWSEHFLAVLLSDRYGTFTLSVSEPYDRP
jgi:hypothetical protein